MDTCRRREASKALLFQSLFTGRNQQRFFYCCDRRSRSPLYVIRPSAEALTHHHVFT